MLRLLVPAVAFYSTIGTAPSAFTAAAVNREAMLTRQTIANPAPHLADALEFLGCHYRDDLSRLLDSPELRTRAAAARGLGRCADKASLALLRSLARRHDPSAVVQIVAAEALGDAHDDSAKSILDSLASFSPDSQVRKYTGRASRRLESPCYDCPLVLWDGYHLRFRFLLEDVASISMADTQGALRHTFEESQTDTILFLFRQGTQEYIDVVREREVLVMTLKDGRAMEILWDESRFVVIDRSHYFHGWSFWMVNDRLGHYLSNVR